MSSRSAPSPVISAPPPSGYVFIGLYPFGSNATRPLCANGKLVLFETVAMARQFLPLLGTGRKTSWQAGGESACWLPLEPNGVNRADIVTDYDPFDTPVNFPGGIRSETHGRQWRHHVMWFEAFTDCGPGHIQKQADGTVVNTALVRAGGEV